jgi:GR25 family glycosyltransferase involved in LPS biosynthesis
MDCFYINLASRPDRRVALERNFATAGAEGWRLHRFEAVTAQAVIDAGAPGILRPQEKGCFLSHRNLIRSIASHGPVMIAEDDVLFGRRTCPGIDAALGAVGEDQWDIVFTDVFVGAVGIWPELIKLRRAFDRTGAFQLLDAVQLQFAGSTSYILNGRSRPLLAALLEDPGPIDLPYDIYLRQLVRQFQLKAYVIFPFATSISDLASQSSIQPDQAGTLDGIANLFRRMVWMERNLSAHAAEIETLRAAYSDPESRAFGVLFEALMSERMRS